jgi:GTP-binding protein
MVNHGDNPRVLLERKCVALPVVVIVGRPNVGKSSLFNALAGQRISIVDPTAGVTRDRVTTVIERNGRFFELIDTGGYGIVDVDKLTDDIEHQIQVAIATAELVLFVVDIKEGVAPLDQEMARLLRKQKLEVMLVANKADTAKLFGQAGEFTRLGFGEAFCVSSTNNANQNVLVEQIFERLGARAAEQGPAEAEIRIAVVGKRNAGKSSLVNALVGENRVIVSEVPGTTRDAIDVPFVYKDKRYVLIDTAGLRKKSKLADSIEFYSMIRTIEGIKRADVVLFLIDASLDLSQVDKKLAETIVEEHKACVVVVNKWDLVGDQAVGETYRDYIDQMLPNLRFAPITCTSATTGENLQTVLDLAAELHEQSSRQIGTGVLNKALERIAERPGGTHGHAGAKILYATQVAVRPISMLLFVNKPELFDDGYQRYLVHQLRDHLGLEEVPIRLMFRRRE